MPVGIFFFHLYIIFNDILLEYCTQCYISPILFFLFQYCTFLLFFFLPYFFSKNSGLDIAWAVVRWVRGGPTWPSSYGQPAKLNENWAGPSQPTGQTPLIQTDTKSKLHGPAKPLSWVQSHTNQTKFRQRMPTVISKSHRSTPSRLPKSKQTITI